MIAQGRPTHPKTDSADETPCDSAVSNCSLAPTIRRENVIFIGSEMSYDLFWLKMMFISAAYVTSRGMGLRPADKNTVAYVDVGYTKLEKLTLDYLKDKAGFTIVKITNSRDIVNHFNTRPEMEEDGKKVKFLLQDVVFFSHGLPGQINFNYKGESAIDLTTDNYSTIRKDVFVPDGCIYSYACRTGVSAWWESFESDNDAGLENSLAQKMANHFKVQVHAFLTRSFYGNVLREPADSSTIAATLKEARKTQKGSVIQIPPAHEALPHPGLADRGSWFHGPKQEGTNEYALWRKGGGIRLPSSHETPKGLSPGMHVFTPQ
jgi:hypothetical protein